MTCMRAQTSSNFGLIGPPTAELAALERMKKIPIGLQWEKRCLHFFSAVLYRILFILAGIMITYMRTWITLKFGQIKPLVSMVTDRVMLEKSVSTFSQLFFIRSFSYLQVTMACIRARTSSNFGLSGPLTAELAALERLKKSP